MAISCSYGFTVWKANFQKYFNTNYKQAFSLSGRETFLSQILTQAQVKPD